VEPARVSSLLTFVLFLQTVTDKRTDLYNRLVASYHKAKTERAEMAHELEAAKGMLSLSLLSSHIFLFLVPAG
jgi:hypothetical protein